MSKDDFQMLHPIGRGGFGKVWRVIRRSNQRTYAMKIMNKARVLAKRSIDSVLNERKFLVILRHPFVGRGPTHSLNSSTSAMPSKTASIYT